MVAEVFGGSGKFAFGVSSGIVMFFPKSIIVISDITESTGEVYIKEGFMSNSLALACGIG